MGAETDFKGLDRAKLGRFAKALGVLPKNWLGVQTGGLFFGFPCKALLGDPPFPLRGLDKRTVPASMYPQFGVEGSHS